MNTERERAAPAGPRDGLPTQSAGRNGRYPAVHIHSEFPGCAPLDETVTYSTLREARTDLARWLRECRRSPNIILFRDGNGHFHATTVDGTWDGWRELRA